MTDAEAVEKAVRLLGWEKTWSGSELYYQTHMGDLVVDDPRETPRDCITDTDLRRMDRELLRAGWRPLCTGDSFRWHLAYEEDTQFHPDHDLATIHAWVVLKESEDDS